MSLLSFPTLVGFIDDDIDYISHFLSISNKCFDVIIEDNPQELLSKINNVNSSSLFTELIISKEEDEIDVPTASFLLSQLPQKVFSNLYRYHAVVVDYNMPMMNGIEFCRKILDPSIKKILLTGEADESVAIEAFNQGLIDAYIKKTTPNLLSIISNYLHRFKKQYLQNIQDKFSPFLKDQALKEVLDNADFNYYLELIISKHKVRRYCAYDTYGSFILEDIYRNQWLLNGYSLSEIVNVIISDDNYNNLSGNTRSNISTYSKVLDYKKPNKIKLNREDFSETNISDVSFKMDVMHKGDKLFYSLRSLSS